jgi:hypothetical protein
MSPRPRASSTGGLPVAVACASWSSIAPRRCRPANAADRLDIEPEVVRTVEASPKPAVQVPPPPKPDKKPRAPTPKDVDVTGSVKPTAKNKQSRYVQAESKIPDQLEPQGTCSQASQIWMGTVPLPLASYCVPLPLASCRICDGRISRVVRSRGHWQWPNAVAAQLIESI